MQAKIVTLCLCLLSLPSRGEVVSDVFIAPGYGTLDFALPQIASYQLPSLGEAADANVLDSDGRSVRLHDLFKNKYTLLAFVYSRCNDANGCPLTAHVFYQIKVAMNQQPELAKNIRLMSVSFDPGNDTPEVMKRYQENFISAADKGEWQFVTTDSEKTLQPILRAYNQDIQQKVTQFGERTYEFSHILRVFLIDPEKNIRNIYSVAFLHADVLLNDIKTLLKEEDQLQHRDDKSSVVHKQYRETSKQNVINFIKKPPLGLPPVPIPITNPITVKKIVLGKKLFFDRRLSLNNTQSCAMCHIPTQGFTNNELAAAVGIEGRSLRRNAPSLFNVAYSNVLFHDGREENLEQQVWGPLLDNNEMANPSVGHVLAKIRHLADYDTLFPAAFNGRGPTMETVGQALASYQRSILFANSLFDRWHYGKQSNVLSISAQRGYALFTSKAGCSQCHTIDQSFALFTDNTFHNTGIGYAKSMLTTSTTHRVQLAPDIFVNVAQSIINDVSASASADIGRYEITENPIDRWKYKTPSLRNVALTAPYMHNGSLNTLEDVIEFYNRGGIDHDLLDSLIKPLNLSNQNKKDLLAFMQSLTGSNID